MPFTTGARRASSMACSTPSPRKSAPRRPPMRILSTGLAALALAGCHAPAPEASNATMPNEAQVESEFQNQQDALAASIEKEANTEEANDSADDGGPTTSEEH